MDIYTSRIPAGLHWHEVPSICYAQEYDRLRRLYGGDGLDWIMRVAGRLRRGIPVRKAIRWACSQYELRESAALAATGYDPDEENRPLPV